MASKPKKQFVIFCYLCPNRKKTILVLQVLRTNQLIVSILFLAYAAVLHAYAFIFPSVFAYPAQGPWGQVIAHWLADAPLARSIAAYLLVSIQAVLLSWVSIRNNLSINYTLFSGLFYILLTGTGIYFLGLSNALIANTFFIAALSELFLTYKKFNAAGTLFNIGFWMALAALFYPSCAILMLLVLVGISSLRPFQLGDLTLAMLGFFVPFFLYGTYRFWNDSLGGFWNELLASFRFFDVPLPPFHWELWAMLALYALLAVLSLLFSDSLMSKKTIDVRKKINLLYVSILCIIFAAIFQAGLGFDHLLFLATPLSLFLGMYFSDTPKKSLVGGVHLMWMVAALLLQYYRIF
jgi:hypothetical protein